MGLISWCKLNDSKCGVRNRKLLCLWDHNFKCGSEAWCSMCINAFYKWMNVKILVVEVVHCKQEKWSSYTVCKIAYIFDSCNSLIMSYFICSLLINLVEIWIMVEIWYQTLCCWDCIMQNVVYFCIGIMMLSTYLISLGLTFFYLLMMYQF